MSPPACNININLLKIYINLLVDTLMNSSIHT